MGGINGHYLRNITLNAAENTEEVLAAVAYATDNSLLFEWCSKHNIPLRFYGRLDENVAVSIPVLDFFLKAKSPTLNCRLVQHHHAKVIWWRGVGLYIGSANLTGSAWYTNVEAGCFFDDAEVSDDMAADVLELFRVLHEKSTPLTDELAEQMRKRAAILGKSRPDAAAFWQSPSFNKWPGLVQTTKKKAADRKRDEFLTEWHATLQELRQIGELVSDPDNRPIWVSTSTPTGAQADQFLHAHYYQRVVDGTKASYANSYEQNKSRRAEALNETLRWWKALPKAPNHEDEMLNVTAPHLQEALSEDGLQEMDEQRFRDVCMGVHAIKDYARRVPNRAVGLPDNGTRYSIPQKVEALSRRIWNDRAPNGSSVVDLLQFVLYSGKDDLLPDRLWQAVSTPSRKIDGLGISALGELVGWALPDRFPPRNGRTSKALRSLGYDVAVHVE
jgi:hypothetical protein